MRSVPPSSLPFADLKPGQTRHLPTRLVSLTAPDPEAGLKPPQKGEPLQIGEITEINSNPRVQKALTRLAADTAASTVSQLVMWNVAGNLDWETIGQLSRGWANRYELSLAKDFVAHLDTLPEGEAGRLQFQIIASAPTNEVLAADLTKAIQGKTILGLRAERGIPTRPEGPSVSCRVRVGAESAFVQVFSSDATTENWVPFGKFTIPLRGQEGRWDLVGLADELAEGLLNRLVRVQLIKGAREKGKLTHRLRIDNASPLRLNGVAALGVTSKEDEAPRVLSGISIPPHRSLTVPAGEEVIKALGLKKGIRVVAIDLSSL
jgi:hypothetical protein